MTYIFFLNLNFQKKVTKLIFSTSYLVMSWLANLIGHEYLIVFSYFFGMAGEKLKDAENNEYVTIYEDKDGDWMLVGDVPWE